MTGQRRYRVSRTFVDERDACKSEGNGNNGSIITIITCVPPPGLSQPDRLSICAITGKRHIGYLLTESHYLLPAGLSGTDPIGPKVLSEGLIGSA